jgi:hypothetical protein
MLRAPTLGMSRNTVIFLFVVMGAIAFSVFQKVGKRINTVGDSTVERFH